MIPESLQKEIFRRYRKHGFKFKNWEELIEQTKLDESKLPTCFYCGKELTSDFKKDKFGNVSIDHKKPKYWKGQNTIENTCLCCHECNIIKGTMYSETFFMFLEALNETGIKDQVFKEMYPGRKAAMMKRKNKKLELWELI